MKHVDFAAVQAGVFAQISADPEIKALIGTHIFDGVPPGVVPDLYLLIGPELVIDKSDFTQSGSEHQLLISALSQGHGFKEAKRLAGVVVNALHAKPPNLDNGRVVFVHFSKANAWRDPQLDARRVDVTFLLRCAQDDAL